MPRSWNDTYLIFNDSIIQETAGDPRYLTLRRATGTGEARKPRRSLPKWTIDLSNLLLSPDQHEELLGFQFQIMGMLNPFLVRNVRACLFETADGTAQAIGVGDGVKTQFQLIREYAIQDRTFTTVVKYPNWNYPALKNLNNVDWEVLPELQVLLDGVVQTTGFTVDRNTGGIIFDEAPADGITVAALGGYYTLMISNTEGIQTTPEGGLYRVNGNVTFSEPEGGL
jgi:uncharacterized protein (TIGR02217 family)